MAVFKAFAPGVEVNGQTVLSVVNGMGTMKSMGLKFLSEAGISDPDPGGWYPQQKWLDAFKLISEKVGKNTLRSIGKSIPESAKFPPQINDIHSALSAIDMAYKMNHRKGEIGVYAYKKIGDKEAEVTCKNPYPSEFDEGIIESMSKKFAKPGEHPTISLENAATSRRSGGDSCIFRIVW